MPPLTKDRAGEKLLRLEAPTDVYAFLRVKPNSAVVHLLGPARWGESLRVKYYQPGQSAGTELTPEPHARMFRITVPKLETWGIVEIARDEPLAATGSWPAPDLS